MSVVFGEGTNIPTQNQSRHRLRSCAICGSSFVSRHETSEVCDDCRTRELQKADQSLGDLDSTGTNSSGGKRRVRLCLNDVVSESANPEPSLKSSLGKTQWRSPPFKILFAETAPEGKLDSVAVPRGPRRDSRLRTRILFTGLAVVVGVGLWISQYGVPEVARQFAQRAIAALR